MGKTEKRNLPPSRSDADDDARPARIVTRWIDAPDPDGDDGPFPDGPPTSITDALFGKTLQRILGLLYGQPTRSFSFSEVVAHAATGNGTVQRHLEALESSGHLVSRRVGNQRRYHTNAASPVHAELCGIAFKTIGVAEPLREALRPLRPGLAAAFIRGTVARGEDTAWSIIDLVAIVDRVTLTEIHAHLEGVDLGREVHVTMHTVPEFFAMLRERRRSATLYLDEPKVFLWGNLWTDPATSEVRVGGGGVGPDPMA